MTTERDPVAFEELEIVRAPGFETEGFALSEFSRGINLVHGPNAAGKTTTADAIERLLWPDAVDNGERLVGQLSLNGEQWRVDVANGRGEYQRDGQEATAPNLPAVDHRDRYRLSLHDLLQHETRNGSFAETIERESAGGYDLSAAHDELGYTDSPISRRVGEFQNAKDAVESWRDERGEAKGLEEERSRLTKLQDDLAAAKQARAEKDALDQAITYREAESSLEAATDKLRQFPDELAEIDGDERQQVDDLDDAIEEWEREKDAAEDERADAAETLDETDLPDDGVSDGTITGLKQRKESFADLDDRTTRLEDELEAAKAKRQSAREDIPMDVDRDALVDLDPGTWTEVSQFARDAHAVVAEQEFQQSVEKWAPDDDTSTSELRTLERGSNALEEWLITVPESDVGNAGAAAFRIGVASSLVVTMAGVALGALVNPMLYGVLLIALGLFAYGYRQRPGTDGTGDERASHRRSFEQTELDPPASWEEAAVQERLVELYGAIADRKITTERHRQRDALVDEETLERKQRSLAETRESLRDNLGAAPDTTDIELAVVVRRVLDWQRAHDEVTSLQAELGEAEDSLADVRATLQAELETYGYADVTDVSGAAEAIRDLERRQADHETATRTLREAERTIENAETKLAELTADREAIFTAVGLEPGSRDELRSLCEQVDAYEAAASDVERKEAVVAQERRKLESMAEYDPDYADRELSTLKTDRRRAEEVASDHDQIQQQISDIEAKINEAKAATAVEDAIAEKDRALGELEDRLHDDYSGMVGDVLVDHVRDATIDSSRPAVFQRANELLATITHGRYKLDLDDDGQAFRAVDTVEQKGRSLDELSSGTRVQVLLAVRLAFVEQQEQDAKLPVVLDETLANTDDLRATVIIESMIELARDGRQVFYFTAQGDEVAKWRHSLEDQADVDWTTIDLATVQNLENGVQIPDLDEIGHVTPDPPDPAEHDHESYAEALDVGSFDPYDGAGAAHLWYVVPDIEVLHDLLELGIERWGQLQNVLERGRDGFVPAPAETVAEIEQNAAALEEFAQSWCIGRGNPVDRSVLEASGAISDTFIDRVAELAAELDGDGKRLVDALSAGEVNRFRSGKADELEEYLREEGYLVPRDPLGEDEIRIRMTERLVERSVPQDQAVERAGELLERVSRR